MFRERGGLMAAGRRKVELHMRRRGGKLIVFSYIAKDEVEERGFSTRRKARIFSST